MKNKKLLKKIIITMFIIIGIIFIIHFLYNNTSILKLGQKRAQAESSSLEMTIDITKVAPDYLYLLVKFEDVDNGIKERKTPEGNRIYANNKSVLALDFIADPYQDYEFKVTNGAGETFTKTIERKYTTEGLLEKIVNINESGIQEIQVKGKTNLLCYEEVTYNLNTIIYDGNLVLDGTTEVIGATLIDNTYEFGDATTDVATATENAKNTVLLKVNGDLTINEGVTLTSVKSSSNYGGPKGMIIYCTGTLINNGTISMTARGGRAVGEDVLLFQNEDGNYEYVPAIGAAHDSAGSNRATGGGGTGAAWGAGNPKAYSGGAGSSYSGGAGSGGVWFYGYNGGYGSSIGGAGSNAGTYYVYLAANNVYGSGGGAGNPGGNGFKNGTSGNNGTGGLLVIYSNIFENNGSITSNGAAGGNGYRSGGGGSGGGSINIFCKNNTSLNINNIKALGGSGGLGTSGETHHGTSKSGKAGGKGSVSIGSIDTGTYVEIEI